MGSRAIFISVLSLWVAQAGTAHAVTIEVHLAGTQSQCEKIFLPHPTTPGTYHLARRRLSIEAQVQSVRVAKTPRFLGKVVEMAVKGALATFFPGGRLTSELTAIPGVDGPGHDRITIATAADGTQVLTAEVAESLDHLAQSAVGGRGPRMTFTVGQCTTHSHSVVCNSDGTLGEGADAFWDSINRTLSEQILQRILETALAQNAPGARVNLRFQWRQRSASRLERREDGALELHGPLYDVSIFVTAENE